MRRTRPNAATFILTGHLGFESALEAIRQQVDLARAIISAMTIHMGIMCDACGTVRFIASSPGIELSHSMEGMYKLTCKPPCSGAKHFRKDEMRPYRVSDEVFSSGYAEVGQYEAVESPSRYGQAS